MTVITNTIITTCTRTKDSTEDVSLLCIIVRKNLESSTINCNSAITIYRVVYEDITTRISTSGTTTIKLCNNNFGIINFSFTISWVNKYIGTTCISIGRHSYITLIILYFITFCTTYDTSYIATLDDNIHIGIHSALLTSCQNNATVIVCLSAINSLVVNSVPFSIYIKGNCTLERHIRRSHQTIQFFSSLTTTDTD